MSIHSNRLSSIAIFGTFEAIWPVASLLGQQLPQSISLIIIEAPSCLDTHQAATLPYINDFYKQLDITADDITHQCKGLYGLGIECLSWESDGGQFFAANSGVLPAINDIPIHQYILKLAYEKNAPQDFRKFYAPFRFCASTALAGKFAFPTDTPNSPVSMLGPRLQFSRRDYSELLKRRFENKARSVISAEPEKVTYLKGSSNIGSVVLDNGHIVTADMYVDVSGDLSALTTLKEKNKVTDLSSLLPFDSRILSSEDFVNLPHSSARAEAKPWGVSYDTPIKGRMLKELLFSCDDIADENDLPPSQSAIKSFKAFFDNQPWQDNLIRLGNASASLGRFWSADFLLLHYQTLFLAQHIPVSLNMHYEAKAFNRLNEITLEELRDFVCLPMYLNQRDEPLWSEIRSTQLPSSLRLRLEQFKSRGRFVPYENEIIDSQLWIDLFIGFGVVPERFDPLVEGLDMSRLIPVLRHMAHDFSQIIDRMPAYRA